MERRRTHELADRLGRALAVELNDRRVEGGGWRHRIAPVCFVSLTLEHPSGMSLSLVHEGSHRKGAAGRRLTVRGGYPSEYIGWRAEAVTMQLRPDGSTAPRARCTGSVRLADHAESAEVLKLTGVPKDLLLQILALVNGQPVLEGRVMPRELGRQRPELSPAPQVIRL